jgi:predicted O-methyltransferase YrrM
MQIGPDQAAFFAFLVRLTNVRRALEIGTFTGYSALAVASALPDDGQLIACDISDEWTRVGLPHWRDAGVESRIDLRLGPAVDTVNALIADGQANSFDFAFIDADKKNYPNYYEACLCLVRPGGLIALDNMLWGGQVADPSVHEEETVVLRSLNEKIRDDTRVEAVLLTVGDGIMLARKR